MRFSTTGSVRRIDLRTVGSAIHALSQEWASLRFGADGRALNPETGQPVDSLRLVEGTHRSPGARYELVTVTDVLEPDPEQLRALDQEMPAGPDRDWAEYHARRSAISVRTGTTETRWDATLDADDARRLALTLHGPDDVWTVELALVHGRLPRLELSADSDVTSLLASDGLPRWLAGLVGGPAHGTGFLDLALLDQRGRATVAEASGAFNRFRAEGTATVTTSARTWDVTARTRLRARGLGRPLLLYFRRRLRRELTETAAQAWAQADQHVAELDRQLTAMRRLAETEGGMGRVVHRTLWEPGYADLVAERTAEEPSSPA